MERDEYSGRPLDGAEFDGGPRDEPLDGAADEPPDRASRGLYSRRESPYDDPDRP